MKLKNNVYTKNLVKSNSELIEEKGFSLRKKTILLIFVSLLFLSYIYIRGAMINHENLGLTLQINYEPIRDMVNQL